MALRFPGRDLVMAWCGDAIWIAGEKKPRRQRVPAFAALAAKGERLLAFGDEAARLARAGTGGVEVLRINNPGTANARPLAVESFFRHVLGRVGWWRALAPRVLAVPPASMRLLARHLLLEAGAREVVLLDRAMAAANGLGFELDQAEPRAVLVLDRHECEFSVIAAGRAIAGFVADAGVERLLDDILLHTLATRGVALARERLHETLLQRGLAGTDAVGWESWIHELGGGRTSPAPLGEEDLRRLSLPFGHLLAWHHRRTLEGLSADGRRELEGLPVHLVGPYAHLQGMAALVGAALGRRVLVAERAETCLLDGGLRVLKDLRALRRLAIRT